MVDNTSLRGVSVEKKPALKAVCADAIGGVHGSASNAKANTFSGPRPLIVLAVPLHSATNGLATVEVPASQAPTGLHDNARWVGSQYTRANMDGDNDEPRRPLTTHPFASCQQY